MASSQQKPKSDKGDKRNPNRRNGKAFPKKLIDRERGTAFTGKGKPTGNSICGISRARVVKMAMAQNTTVEELEKQLKAERARKREMRKLKRNGSRYAQKVEARDNSIPRQRRARQEVNA